MIDLVKTILSIIITILSVFLALFIIWGIYDEIMGPKYSKRFLKKIKFPLSYNWTVVAGLLCGLVISILSIIRSKL